VYVLEEADFEERLGAAAMALRGDGVDTAEKVGLMERLGVPFNALLENGVDDV